jgi:5'-3' exonuclease
MDKILLIDGMNFIWRANTTFSFGKNKHYSCHECDENRCIVMLHEHCVCGGRWIDGKCSEEPNPEFIPIFNFFRNLRPIIEMFSPEKCFFVLEGHPQFRYDLFADYKANRIIKQASRKEDLDKFHKAKNEIVRLIQLLPITTCRATQYECDDVIGSLCNNLKDEELVILSNDSDYIQLLQRGYKSCRIYNPIKKEFMASPDYPYVAWKSLNGDKSDNIPALLSPKKALNTVTSPDKFKSFLNVEENRANFSVNRQLIEFRNVPEEEIEIQEGHADFSTLKEEFVIMQFESIINDKSWEKFKNTFDCLKF